MKRLVAGNQVGGINRANERHSGQGQGDQDDQRDEQDDTALAAAQVTGEGLAVVESLP
jgi:hypothetical protein